MSQVGAPRTQGLSGVDGFRDAHVGWMRPPPQGIQDQDVESAEMLALGSVDPLHIGDIGQVADAVAEDPQVTVPEGQRENIYAGDANNSIGLDHLQVQTRFRSTLEGTDRVVENVIE